MITPVNRGGYRQATLRASPDTELRVVIWPMMSSRRRCGKLGGPVPASRTQKIRLPDQQRTQRTLWSWTADHVTDAAEPRGGGQWGVGVGAGWLLLW